MYACLEILESDGQRSNGTMCPERWNGFGGYNRVVCPFKGKGDLGPALLDYQATGKGSEDYSIWQRLHRWGKATGGRLA